MTDNISIKVVRLDSLVAALWGEIIPNDVEKLVALIERVGDMIELTAEQHRPWIDDGEMMGLGELRGRLISEWESVDD